VTSAARPGPSQVSLFEDSALPPAVGPQGLGFQPAFIDEAEESALVGQFASLDLKPFAFQGWEGRRETVSFGWRYDFSESRVHAAPPIPPFLLPLRERAAAFAGLSAGTLEQALVIRYDEGAGIGWHRDRPVFDRVVGVSLLAACVMRLRRRTGRSFERFALPLPPRSAYLLTGEVRHDWEHSILPQESQRYSVTFRSR
jgi:DNA oxidative demethylase